MQNFLLFLGLKTFLLTLKTHLNVFANNEKLQWNTSAFNTSFEVYSGTVESDAEQYTACNSEDEVDKDVEGCVS